MYKQEISAICEILNTHALKIDVKHVKYIL